jgi:AraC-like DNA-binding protein
MNQVIYTDQDRNAIRFSDFKKLDSDCPFSGIGVKYVVSGEEIYFANDKKYSVKVGEYIIGNEFTKSTVQINNKSSVKGLCIDISSGIIVEVAEFYAVNGSELREFLLSDQFFVNRYNVQNTGLGYALLDISGKISSGTFVSDFEKNDLFYSLAESIVADQRFVFDHLSKLEFKKLRTNEELFRSALEAKAFIDQHLSENISLDTMALQAGISKYHFIRVFKSVFGISPYKYQKSKQLELAKYDLLSGEDILSTAIRYGYPDVSAFSKAFKKLFGLSPRAARKSNY